MGNHDYLGKCKTKSFSTIASDPGLYLIEDTPKDNETDMDDEDASMGGQYDNHLIDKIYEGKVSRDIDLDKIIPRCGSYTPFQDLENIP